MGQRLKDTDQCLGPELAEVHFQKLAWDQGSFHWEVKRRPLQLPQPWDRATSVIISLWMLSFPGGH